MQYRANKFKPGDGELLIDIMISIEKPFGTEGWLALLVRD
jgi:hypothetical protein